MIRIVYFLKHHSCIILVKLDKSKTIKTFISSEEIDEYGSTKKPSTLTNPTIIWFMVLDLVDIIF